VKSERDFLLKNAPRGIVGQEAGWFFFENQKARGKK
jgi:hypothetical protein